MTLQAESDSRAPIAISSTAGYGGGGATAFPAEDSGKKLPGEHLSDFGGKVQSCSMYDTLACKLSKFPSHCTMHTHPLMGAPLVNADLCLHADLLPVRRDSMASAASATSVRDSGQSLDEESPRHLSAPL